MSVDQRDQCRKGLEYLISRTGFQRGYFHVEFIVHSRGAAIIDANVGRLGGGSVGEQIADSFDLDPIDVYQHTIQCSIFPNALNVAPYRSERVATLGVLYGVQTRGVFEELMLPANMNARHTQILDTGQLVPEMGLNNWAWIGILSGRTPNVEEAIRRVRIRANGKWHSPCY
ncbi:MAG: hypothetical protein HC902_08710 [Calothrix sp. SM1_5_4]|nr:hypothetical protein [Calothrix sp. SM1_5_4]